MRLFRATSALTLLCLCVLARADLGAIRLTTFPQAALADARSTVTVTAEVRQSNGRLAPDGTQVVFQTTLGHFQETATTTTNGYARATLVTAGTAGTAKITASAITLGATTTSEVDMVANRNDLASANFYIDVLAPTKLQYSMDDQILYASGAEHGVKVRFGKVSVETDDMQYNMSSQELRARRAKVTIKGHSYEFADLVMQPQARTGTGTTSYSGPVFTFSAVGRMVAASERVQPHFGLVQVMLSGDIKPIALAQTTSKFDFEDVSDSSSTVTARRAVIFPNREIQFQQALLAVNGTKIMSLALYKVNLSGGPSTFGDQVLTLNESHIGVNYPYYISLEPGHTSLFRFVTGQPSGRSLSGNSAALLNYELTWNKGDGTEGGLTVTGLNQPNWSLDAHHSLHFNDGSSLTALASSPERRSLFGSIGYNKPLKGFQFSMNSSSSRSLVGPKTSTSSLTSVLESDPHKVKSLPLTLYFGLTATDTSADFGVQSQRTQNTGLRLRGQFNTFILDKATSVNAAFSVGRNWGSMNGLALYSSIGLSRAMKGGAVNLNYEYTGDNSLAALIAGGRQRLSLDGTYGKGKANMHLFASKSLDANWTSLYGDMSYQMSGLYRISTGYTLDQYLGSRSLDYNFVLSYRIGIREVGLVWSRHTNRVGFEVLGARF